VSFISLVLQSKHNRYIEDTNIHTVCH